MSGRRCPAPPALTAWLDARRPLPAHVAYLERRYGGEPYRLALALLAADLEAASQVDMTARLLDEAPHQARVTVESIQEVLDMIAGAIPREIAADHLRTVRIQTATFGLHAARLDIREDSGRLAAALGGMLDALGIDAGFAERDDAHRAARAPAPPVGEAARGGRPGRGRGHDRGERRGLAALPPPRAHAEPLSAGVARSVHHLDDARRRRHAVTVLLLGRWAGCAPAPDIVPLFETLDDLDAAPRILSELFALDAYRAHLRPVRRRADGDDRLFRQQQGRRIPRGELGALPGAGSHRAAWRPSTASR